MSNKDKIQYVLATDVETTGLSWVQGDPAKNHQIVSIGLIVADATTFKPIEKLYLEIKWNDESIQMRQADPKFGQGAEKVHGLTKSYLDENGISEEDAVVRIAELIMKYWSAEVTIQLLGHNIATFDVFFIRQLLYKYDLYFKFASRMFDSFSLGVGTTGAFNSDELFDCMGFDTRGNHNALDDAMMSLECFRMIKLLWKQNVGLLVERDQ